MPLFGDSSSQVLESCLNNFRNIRVTSNIVKESKNLKSSYDLSLIDYLVNPLKLKNTLTKYVSVLSFF